MKSEKDPLLRLGNCSLDNKESKKMQHWTNAQLFEHFADLEHAQECVKTELRKRDLDWQHLAHAGLFSMAVTVYREKYKVDLREAFDAVRAFNKEVATS